MFVVSLEGRASGLMFTKYSWAEEWLQARSLLMAGDITVCCGLTWLVALKGRPFPYRPLPPSCFISLVANPDLQGGCFISQQCLLSQTMAFLFLAWRAQTPLPTFSLFSSSLGEYQTSHTMALPSLQISTVLGRPPRVRALRPNLCSVTIAREHFYGVQTYTA